MREEKTKKQKKAQPQKRRSILSKVTNSVLIILIPSLLVLIIIACTFAASAVSNLTKQNVELQTKSAINQVDDFFKNKITASSMFKANTAIRMTVQGQDKQSIESSQTFSNVLTLLDSALNSMEEQGVQAAWAASRSANVYIMSDGRVVDADLSSEAWYDDLLEKNDVVVSEPYLDTVSGKTIISTVGPVFNESGSDIVGFVGFDIYQDSLTERLSGIKIGEEGFIDLISKTNTYIYSADESVIGTDIESVSALSDDYKQKVAGNFTGEFEYEYLGTDYYAISGVCEVTGWSAVSNIPINEINQTRDQLILVLSIITIVILIILVVTLVLRIKKLISPLKFLTAGVEEFAQGSLGVEITVDTNDEIGSLADSIRMTIHNLKGIIDNISYILSEISAGNLCLTVDGNYIGDFMPIKDALINIVSSLNSTMTNINESSGQVALGADQVSSGAQTLSQGSTEQASSVEQLAATVNEIAGQVKENAVNAQDASRKASETGDQIMVSNQEMEEMVNAMDKISDSSKEIGKIIKTIEDIAFQTNILALNAAVEAARAGEAGKGFAVVADEVRNLASKSSDASKDTSVLIEGSLHAVENGIEIAQKTAMSLFEAVEGAKVVAETINKISDASTMQADAITQVTQGIDQISSVVQTNSATAEESAAASEELSGQAQVLKDLVGKFKLDSHTAHPKVQKESASLAGNDRLSDSAKDTPNHYTKPSPTNSNKY